MGSPMGDYLRAVHSLGVGKDPATREALAKLFGLSFKTSSSPTPGASQNQPQTQPLGKSPISKPLRQTTRAPSTTPVPIAATVRQLAPQSGSPLPEWLSTIDPLPASAQRVIPTKPSLYEPRWVRAILTTALGTYEDTDELDLTRLLEDVVNQRTVQRLPLRKAPSLAHGVYCWIDNSPSMQLFTTDQMQIVLDLYNSVGPARLNVLPTKGVPPRLPNLIAGVPHLVLSDLGGRVIPGEIRSDRPKHWAEWANAVSHDHDTSVIAFVPGPLEHYPPELHQACILIQWDRQTSVQNVRRALVNAHA